jgi:hypothetical protein
VIAAITVAYQRRRGSSWAKTLKACSGALFVAGIIAFIVAMPISFAAM